MQHKASLLGIISAIVIEMCTLAPHTQFLGRVDLENAETGASKSCLIFCFFFRTHRGLLSIHISLQLYCNLFEARGLLISGPSTGNSPREKKSTNICES